MLTLTTLTRFAERGATLLSDILTNPTFEPEELAREKNVIVQEIGATEDTPTT